MASCHNSAPKVTIVCCYSTGWQPCNLCNDREPARPTLIYVVLQVATVALALWLSKQSQVTRLYPALIALAPTLPGAYLAWAAYRDDRREAAADTDAKAKTLAAAVAAAETRQRAQLIGPGAHRIDVAFHQRIEPANNATGAAPHGHLTDIVTYYQGLRPARLAITGEPGAGKTLLALDLILGMLTHPSRTDTDPVPVRFSLAGWDTDRPLQEWLAHQVHQQFRDQGITLADAAVLVDRHRILPVLDGLDEMDTDANPAGRRRAARALQELNDYQHSTGSAPAILTCRITQYEDLAALDLRMREAARIELDPVSPGQAAAYLTSRSTSPDRWRPVIDMLTTAPGGTLARALATPWRLNLAATAYEERHPDTLAYLREPDHLLTMGSPSAVRDHLLARYLPAAAHQHPTRPGRYRPDQAHHWLATLAAHLTTTIPTSAGSGTDIVLHQLWPMAGPRRVRTADALLAALLALAFAALPLAQTRIGFSPRQQVSAAGFALVALGTVWRASGGIIPDPRGLAQCRARDRTRGLARDRTRGPARGLAQCRARDRAHGRARDRTRGTPECCSANRPALSSTRRSRGRARGRGRCRARDRGRGRGRGWAPRRVRGRVRGRTGCRVRRRAHGRARRRVCDRACGRAVLAHWGWPPLPGLPLLCPNPVALASRSLPAVGLRGRNPADLRCGVPVPPPGTTGLAHRTPHSLTTAPYRMSHCTMVCSAVSWRWAESC